MYRTPKPFNWQAMLNMQPEKHGCPGPCEACHPTYEKRIRVVQHQEVFRSTIVYALSNSLAAKEIEENEHEYDWEYEELGWETVESCSEPLS
jgi:hypothetical protein